MKINYSKLILINYLYILLLEIVFKTVVLKSMSLDIIYLIIFTMPVAVIISFISSLFKRKAINKTISIIFWILLFFIFAVETVYYSFYSTICGFEALIYGGQVMEFAGAIMSHIKSNIFILTGSFIPLFTLIILSLTKVITHEKYILKDTFALLISTFFFSISSLELNSDEVDSAKELYFNKNSLMQTTNKLGLVNAVSLDSVKFIIKFEETFNIDSAREFTKEKGVEYNITDIDFDSLISSESDSTVKNMHIYFQNQLPTNKNDKTGIFAGKNLIFITAEGFYPIAVDEKVTPTLYKLVNNSFIFDHYYQPIYNCSTSDGEFINQLSLLPGVSTCSMKSTIGVDLPYSVGNIFKNYGYNSYAFHGWTYNYYSRDKTVPNLGYEYYGYDRYKRGYKNALQGIKDSWPTSDIDVVNSSYGIYSKDKKFATYYMSISGHLEYNFNGGNAISKKNKDLVKDVNGNDAIKAYIATQIEFDKSLEILLNNLENDGILDDTVIVIAADHYPYGLTDNDIESYVDWIDDIKFDLYKNNLIIYNSEVENEHIDKYVSSLDILPTILNLFGINYDSRLLMGKDVFSDEDGLVIFNNKDWITSKGRYSYIKKKFTSFNGEEEDPEYIKNMNEIVDLKFQMSKLVISKNYYKKLGGF